MRDLFSLISYEMKEANVKYKQTIMLILLWLNGE
jgi:hypothetical protein